MEKLSLRLPGETDDEFRERAERLVPIAQALVRAALANLDVQEFIADPTLAYWTEESVRRQPTIRLDYEQAFAIGDLPTCYRYGQKKNWGAGPFVLPVERDDPVDPWRILYVYKPASIYNRRFMQRRRMKELLGRDFRKLVNAAFRNTKGRFLAELGEQEAWKIKRVFDVTPGVFWRAAKGVQFLDLPPKEHQLEFDLQ